ncbi:MAG: MarR family transcriptional regulator [Proteobacteria bacterium]|nr:MarR family transcriptional regulator [Pseudomonadota bacterium]
MIGITGPQWNILMAIDHLDEGGGVSVIEIANKLHVNSTFVIAQSKIMGKSGHLRRVTAKSDHRIVLVSLRQTTINKLNGFYKQRKQVNKMVFGHFFSERISPHGQSK